MTDDLTPNNPIPIAHTLTLRGQRYDESARPFEATIKTNRFGGVEVSVAAARGRRGTYLTVDFADIDTLCAVLSAAALEASDRHLEFVANASANTAIYVAQQSAARLGA